MTKEADLQYLRNIGIQPGPNAGMGSIGPTKPYIMRRPTGNNADEWQLFLQEWLSIENGSSIEGTAFVAVQIAEAIDAAIATRIMALEKEQIAELADTIARLQKRIEELERRQA